jgi:hypothetical protein
MANMEQNKLFIKRVKRSNDLLQKTTSTETAGRKSCKRLVEQVKAMKREKSFSMKCKMLYYI